MREREYLESRTGRVDWMETKLAELCGTDRVVGFRVVTWERYLEVVGGDQWDEDDAPVGVVTVVRFGSTSDEVFVTGGDLMFGAEGDLMEDYEEMYGDRFDGTLGTGFDAWLAVMG